MTSSSEIVRHGASHDGHSNSAVQAGEWQEAGYFSSSPLESPHTSPFSMNDGELSLGVYFSPDNGELNDVLAALRASLRVVKETTNVILGLRPKTDQVKEFAEILHSHEREFTAWIFDGAGILPTTRIAIRSLHLFSKLVVYINLLKDLQSDLPYRISSTPPPTKVNFLRRLSSSTPSHSRPSMHPQPSQRDSRMFDSEKNPRLTAAITRVGTSFTSLKEEIELFRNEQRRLKASQDIMERTRKELGIPHELCLQGTRNDVKAIVNAWANKTPSGNDAATKPLEPPVSTSSNPDTTHSAVNDSKPILVLVGDVGSGKSSLATTLACEWKRQGTLRAHLFITPPQRKMSSGKRSSGEDSEEDGSKQTGVSRRGSTLSRALSRIAHRRGSNGHAQMRAKAGSVAAFEAVLATLSIKDESKASSLVVVDGLDHAREAESKRVVELIKQTAQGGSNVKIVLTLRHRESPLIHDVDAAGLVDFIRLVESPDTAGSNEGGRRVEDAQDIGRYVSSRLAVMLLPKDQERVVATVNGNFADAVRVCHEVEESGAPERALDGILYREAIRRHGTDHVKFILI